jgi:hypothetical protein
MVLTEVVFVFAAPYLLAWMIAHITQRVNILPITASPATLARNNLGRLSTRQRQALLLYSLPEIVFGLTAIVFALGWQPSAGFNVAALRWGLAGMALVRLGLLWPVWRDLLSGRVLSLRGPLRKIRVGARRALATEDGPLLVLPVEGAIYAAYDDALPVTIFYTPFSKRVVAVQPQGPEPITVDVHMAPA